MLKRYDKVETISMIALIMILLLIVVSGWLDSRLNWQQADAPKQQEAQ